MTKPGSVHQVTVGRSLRALWLESEYLAVTILLDQGADILELTHKPTGVDVLWKVPYPVLESGIGPTPSGDSFAQWIHHYRGGWQTILPNYGPAVIYRGSLLDFHGEAARRPWQLESEAYEDGVEIIVSTDLASLPLTVRRRISLSATGPRVDISESVTNTSNGPVDCMWAHHPVFGAPLLSSDSRLYAGARLIHTDAAYDVTGNDLRLGEVSEWPFAVSKAGRRVDLSRIPAQGSGFSRVIFLKDFERTWCALVNPGIPLGVALNWSLDVMPYMCVWQETGGVQDFPHFGKSYTTALEPSACLFGHGLIDAIEKTKTQVTLQSGETRRFQLTATLFSDGRGVRNVSPEGDVEFGT